MSLSRAAHRTFSPGAAPILLPSMVKETLLAFTSTFPLMLSLEKEDVVKQEISSQMGL
jgi:hypothetical protein